MDEPPRGSDRTLVVWIAFWLICFMTLNAVQYWGREARHEYHTTCPGMGRSPATQEELIPPAGVPPVQP